MLHPIASVLESEIGGGNIYATFILHDRIFTNPQVQIVYLFLSQFKNISLVLN